MQQLPAPPLLHTSYTAYIYVGATQRGIPSEMAEGTLKSYDPLAYYVNNISDLDPEVVSAHRNKDTQRQSELLSRSKNHFDVFICVNRHAHAFVLCVPCGPVDQVFEDVLSKDPFQVPEIQLCWRYELCFENQQLRMYKIKKEFSLFKTIKEKIDKSYYVGMYKDVSPIALQFAALRSFIAQNFVNTIETASKLEAEMIEIAYSLDEDDDYEV